MEQINLVQVVNHDRQINQVNLVQVVNHDRQINQVQQANLEGNRLLKQSKEALTI